MNGENAGMFDAPTFQDFDEPMGVGTHPYGPAGGTVPRISGPNGVPSGPDEDGRRNGPLVATIVGATVLLLGLSCVLLLALTGALSGLGSLFATAQPTPTVPLTTVPNFVNTQFTAAQALAQTNHLKVVEVDTANSAAAGTVISQDVPPGSSVEWDRTITLTVSSGPGTVIVPDVTKKEVGTACSMLEDPKYGLHCHQAGQEYNATVPFGEVTRTDPKAGATAKPGDTVEFWVSNGPQPTPTVPAPTVTPTPSPTATNTPPPGP
jgi:beta-lactam-binding protein with PASTA domain